MNRDKSRIRPARLNSGDVCVTLFIVCLALAVCGFVLCPLCFGDNCPFEVTVGPAEPTPAPPFEVLSQSLKDDLKSDLAKGLAQQRQDAAVTLDHMKEHAAESVKLGIFATAVSLASLLVSLFHRVGVKVKPACSDQSCEVLRAFGVDANGELRATQPERSLPPLAPETD